MADHSNSLSKSSGKRVLKKNSSKTNIESDQIVDESESNSKLEEKKGDFKDILSSFTFKKKSKQDEMQIEPVSISKKKSEENIDENSNANSTAKSNTAREILMKMPTKRGSKSSKKETDSEMKLLKNQIKEKQIEDIAQYIFTMMKDPRQNAINKNSLKKVLMGLSIDNIMEEQAEKMLNYPNLDAKEIQKDALTYDELKDLIRVDIMFKIHIKECNFRFDSDGKLL